MVAGRFTVDVAGLGLDGSVRVLGLSLDLVILVLGGGRLSLGGGLFPGRSATLLGGGRYTFEEISRLAV